MKKLARLEKDLESITKELTSVDSFRDTPASRKFKRQLQGDLSNIKEQIKKLNETIEQKQESKIKIHNKANQNRSSKNKRNWNYVKSIQRNYYPDKSLKEIRSLLKKHRQGLETDIPDVAWRNPSP
jgi:hypothetical protein